jgi:hypothetical protein
MSLKRRIGAFSLAVGAALADAGLTQAQRDADGGTLADGKAVFEKRVDLTAPIR